MKNICMNIGALISFWILPVAAMEPMSSNDNHMNGKWLVRELMVPPYVKVIITGNPQEAETHILVKKMINIF